MNINEFWKELARHDWSFERSDDMSVFEKGRSNQDKLVALAHNNGDEWTDLYKGWSSHINKYTPIPAYRGFCIVYKAVNARAVSSWGWAIFKEGESGIIDIAPNIWEAVKLIDAAMDEVDRAINSPVNKMLDNMLSVNSDVKNHNVIPFRGGNK